MPRMTANMEMLKAGGGPVAEKLLASNMDVGVLRPYWDVDGKAYMSITKGYTINEKGDRVPILEKLPVTNATLRKDEWLAYDAAVIRAARERLVLVSTLLAAGLVYNVDGMSKMALETENLSEFTAAELTMDGVNRATKDRPNFELAGIPLPIVHKEFDVTARVLNASRERGESLDTTSAELAGRKVAEKIEDLFILGSSNYKAAGYTLYGLLDFPSSNTGSTTANWDDSAASGETIKDDVLSMMQDANDDNFYGPFLLIVPGNYNVILEDDFNTNYGNMTIRQRLMNIEGISNIIVADRMTDEKVILVQFLNS